MAAKPKRIGKAGNLPNKNRNIIGSKTRKNVLDGKTVRLNAKGFQMYEDFYSPEKDENSIYSNPSPMKSIKKVKKANNLKESLVCETPKNQSIFSVSRRLLTPRSLEDNEKTEEKPLARDDSPPLSAVEDSDCSGLATPKVDNPKKKAGRSKKTTGLAIKSTNSKKASEHDRSYSSPELIRNVNECSDEDEMSPMIGQASLPPTPATAKQSSLVSAQSTVLRQKTSALKSMHLKKSLNEPDDVSDCSGFLTPVVDSPVKKLGGTKRNIVQSNESPSPAKVPCRNSNNENNAHSESSPDSTSNTSGADRKSLTAPSWQLSDSEDEAQLQLVNESPRAVKKVKKTPSRSEVRVKSKENKVKKKMKKKTSSITPKNAAKSVQKVVKKSPIFATGTSESQVNNSDNGIRRSRRTRLPRLDYWKQERPIYKRTSSGVAIVGVKSPIIKSAVVTKSRSQKRSSGSKAKRGNDPSEEPEFDQDTYFGTKVINPHTGQEEVQTCIGEINAASYNPIGEKSRKGDAVSVTKLFTSHLFTCGYLTLNSLAEKKKSCNKEYTIIYSIAKGKVKVQIHETCYILRTSNIFVIPKANFYSLTNLLKTKAVLQYTCITAPDYSFAESDSEHA